MAFLWTIGILIILNLSPGMVEAGTECVPKSFGYDSIVCVCNASYCDEFELATHLPSGQYLLYTSTKAGLRFKKSFGSFSPSSNASCLTLNVDRTSTYQTIEGFGTAFTDASGVNLLSLSPKAQQNLMRSYFSSSGIKLNMGRVPIGGCDFSTRVYTYDDYKDDIELTKFNLAWEDYKYKIPMITWAQNLRKQRLKLEAAAWSPPTWMKTNHKITGFSLLDDKYFQLWANYHIKFLDAYKENDIKFWAISTGNEPLDGIIPLVSFNSLGWTPDRMRRWIAENIGPTLRASNHSSVMLLANDDQRFFLPWLLHILFEDKRVEEYIDGIAVHWYFDKTVPAQLLSLTHEAFPSKVIIATEASIVTSAENVSAVRLGDWSNGEEYMADIIEDLSNWVTGWIDWNLALNPEGGPNWAHNYVDASIIVNAKKDEFYKQPMFYALGHFSKFVPEGSVRIRIEPNNKKEIKALAFTTPDKATVIIMFNEGDRNTKITIADPDRGYINFKVAKKSFSSLLYW